MLLSFFIILLIIVFKVLILFLIVDSKIVGEFDNIRMLFGKLIVVFKYLNLNYSFFFLYCIY